MDVKLTECRVWWNNLSERTKHNLATNTFKNWGELLEEEIQEYYNLYKGQFNTSQKKITRIVKDYGLGGECQGEVEIETPFFEDDICEVTINKDRIMPGDILICIEQNELRYWQVMKLKENGFEAIHDFEEKFFMFSKLHKDWYIDEYTKEQNIVLFNIFYK